MGGSAGEEIRGQVAPVGWGSRAGNPYREVVLGHQLAGEADLPFQHFGRQEETLVSRRAVDFSRFDLDQAQPARPVSSTAGTHPKACRLQDLTHGRLVSKGHLACNIVR